MVTTSTPKHEYWFKAAAEVAKKATCKRSLCGSVVVSAEGVCIGEGFNSPTANLEAQRRCLCHKEDLHRKVTDKTCCVHAEQRAIMEALRRNPDKLSGSCLYFARLDDNGDLEYSGPPYCTICSKMALDVGVAYFGLWHKEGIRMYPTQEYNKLSYAYTQESVPPDPAARGRSAGRP